MQWVWSNAGMLWGLTLTHLWLALPPIVVGFVVSIPLGYWASRSSVARAVLLTLGNVLYTIPSIALVVFVPVVLGFALLSPANVVVALAIYAVAIMVRSAADAFAAVPDSVRQSAIALGHSPLQRFFLVELPLAGPVLVSGLRVVSVSTVSLVTIGALVGVDSLGNLFTDGFQRQFPLEIWTGIVLVLAIAGALDLLFTLAARAVMPWNRRARTAAPPAPVLRATGAPESAA